MFSYIFSRISRHFYLIYTFSPTTMRPESLVLYLMTCGDLLPIRAFYMHITYNTSILDYLRPDADLLQTVISELRRL